MSNSSFFNNIESLPEEIIELIMNDEAIDLPAACALLSTSEQFKRLMQKPTYWRRFGVNSYGEFMQMISKLHDPSDPIKTEYKRLALKQ